MLYRSLLRSPLAALGLLTVSAMASSLEAQDPFRRGDVNGDGYVTTHDACMIFQGLFVTGFFIRPDAADANDDGVVNMSDNTAILNLVFGLAPSLPSPGADARGPDPTEDDLDPCSYEACDVTFQLGGDHFIRGDCDQSAAMEMFDATFTLEMLFLGGPNSTCLAACDSNDDGKVDIADAVYSLSFLYGVGGAPPSPYPNCSAESDCTGVGCGLGAACP